MSDWDRMNDLDFLFGVRTTGKASELIRLPNTQRKRRFPPQHPDTAKRYPGWAKWDDGALRMQWAPFSGWEAKGNHYGYLHVIAPTKAGDYRTWPVTELLRPALASGVMHLDAMDWIFGDMEPPRDNALCGFWIGSVPGTAHQRRSDVLPWTYHAQQEKPVLTKPKLSEIRAYYPSNPTPPVYTWPIVANPEITARWRGEDIEIRWPAGTFKDWHAVRWQVRDGVWRQVFGTLMLTYYTGSEWVRDGAEYLAHPNHATGVRFNFRDKLRHASERGGGPIDPDAPIRISIAGHCRYNPKPSLLQQQQTAGTWLDRHTLEPYEWDDEPVEPSERDDAITECIEALERLR